ncbi:MAG: hypothetical protein XXXJIFNMEKO3_00529 [Candidatus Erwinia impunctatus]|nr:hypothetical protein XXXJIFNMEKO_00529 [Culicoides impunctatus]
MEEKNKASSILKFLSYFLLISLLGVLAIPVFSNHPDTMFFPM